MSFGDDDLRADEERPAVVTREIVEYRQIVEPRTQEERDYWESQGWKISEPYILAPGGSTRGVYLTRRRSQFLPNDQRTGAERPTT